VLPALKGEVIPEPEVVELVIVEREVVELEVEEVELAVEI
jgi:hypothetical protein